MSPFSVYDRGSGGQHSIYAIDDPETPPMVSTMRTLWYEPIKINFIRMESDFIKVIWSSSKAGYAMLGCWMDGG